MGRGKGNGSTGGGVAMAGSVVGGGAVGGGWEWVAGGEVLTSREIVKVAVANKMPVF